MNRKALEKLFERYDVYYDEVGLDVRDVRTGKHIGSVHYVHGTTGSEVIAVRNDEISALHQPKLVMIGAECSFRNAHELANSMNCDRRLEGKREASESMVNREFKACIKVEFEACVELLKAWLDFQFFPEGKNELAPEMAKRLTQVGKRNYAKVQKARTSVVAEPKPYTGPHGWNQAIRDLHGAPVASLARTLADGEAERETSSKRTVWGAEDDAIMALVMEEHKKLSDRVAQLHSARGSRISIPEFDRRRAAKAQQ